MTPPFLPPRRHFLRAPWLCWVPLQTSPLMAWQQGRAWEGKASLICLFFEDNGSDKLNLCLSGYPTSPLTACDRYWHCCAAFDGSRGRAVSPCVQGSAWSVSGCQYNIRRVTHPSPWLCPSVLPSAHGQCGQKGAGAWCDGVLQVSGAAGGGHPWAPREVLACKLLLYLLILGLALCWGRWPGALVSSALNISALKVKSLHLACCSAGSQAVMILRRREPEAFGITWYRGPDVLTGTSNSVPCNQ